MSRSRVVGAVIPPDEGVVPRHVLDGKETALLDVDGPHQPLPNPSGDRISDPRSASPALNLACLRVSRTEVRQLRNDRQVAAHLPEVKGHRRRQEPVAVPAPRHLLKTSTHSDAAMRHSSFCASTPCVSRWKPQSRRPSLTVPPPAGSTRRRPGHRHRRRQAVVLVRGERELAARRAAEGEPCILDRWPAVAVEGELEQACGSSVAQQCMIWSRQAHPGGPRSDR